MRAESIATAEKNPEAIPHELVVQYIVGAYMAVMTWWLDRGEDRDPPNRCNVSSPSHRGDAFILCWQALALTGLDVLQQVRAQQQWQLPAIRLSGDLQSMMRVAK